MGQSSFRPCQAILVPLDQDLTTLFHTKVRVGNKTNIEDIDRQISEITDRMQWFTADILQLEEMRNVETDLMLIQVLILSIHVLFERATCLPWLWRQGEG